MGGAVGTLILVALVWWCMRRRKIAREAAVMMPSTMHAVHIAPGECGQAGTALASVLGRLRSQAVGTLLSCMHSQPTAPASLPPCARLQRLA